ncbi:hypothetical protein [Nocardioides coralli]|uniref:hypothetical protein n=1 Tax=Nocardioides coralli TaxID=2872154 RepID=UPI002017D2E5|nr:hypothetical protein [Nocardioides coralli]
MNFEPVALDLATRLTLAEVTSARPDAPVITPASRTRPLDRSRTALAGALQRVAAWVEPTPVPDAACRA